MTFDWAWLDLWFDICCCWLCLQWEPTSLLASAEKLSPLVISWVVHTAEQKGETVPNGMASGGKREQVALREQQIKLIHKKDSTPTTWTLDFQLCLISIFQKFPDFWWHHLVIKVLKISRNCSISIFFYRTTVWLLQSDLQVQNYPVKPHCL